jgi:uncharacterized protein (DUF1697 family)
MMYVALLRGINVGGNAKVEMPKLKAAFEREGFTKVSTYINSGNVIFESVTPPIASHIEKMIEDDFGLPVKVLIRDKDELEAVTKALPEQWQNNDSMKCDVMFLWEEVDNPAVLAQLPTDPNLEDIVYIPGAVIWRVDRVHQPKSKMDKIIGTNIYKKMTARNCNTVRKLFAMMSV